MSELLKIASSLEGTPILEVTPEMLSEATEGVKETEKMRARIE